MVDGPTWSDWRRRKVVEVVQRLAGEEEAKSGCQR